MSMPPLSDHILEKLPYKLGELPREQRPYYIGPDDTEISSMLKTGGKNSLEELFSHIDEEVKFSTPPDLGKPLPYETLITHVQEMASKNERASCFIGDGLKWGKTHPIVEYVSNVRGLTTAYTPYQPERSQGTLHSLWIYSNLLSQITGMEAINASLYDRSTALFESLNTALRIKKGKKKVIVSSLIYPGDWEVLQTLAKGTELEILKAPFSQGSRGGQPKGLIDEEKLHQLLKDKDIAAVALPHVNSLGLVEDISKLTNTIREHDALVIGIIDPLHYVTGGLLPPSQWGEKGAHMIVGEAQHLATGPNFGGPGLGLFGIRYNEEDKMAIRSTPGRFVGKGKDEKQEDALLMVLSTREQHIRREKATSNICSNQSFMATLVGASLLGQGEEGLKEALASSRRHALKTTEILLERTSLELFSQEAAFLNEVSFKLPCGGNSPPPKACELIEKAACEGLHLGADISKRAHEEALMLFFNNAQSREDREKLIHFLCRELPRASHSSASKKNAPSLPLLNASSLRQGKVGLLHVQEEELKGLYTKLGLLNLSPDNGIYPLGSCTMKYNPYINDYAAGLKGFTDIHPQAPLRSAQGNLEILYHIQEFFKKITGLFAVTTEPVAGAQGELVGLKLFQAYHEDRQCNQRNKQERKRDIILIPASAHGTNPASAQMAGYLTSGRDPSQKGIITIKSYENGEIDFEQLKEIVSTYNQRIAGIMITNPNTSGIFETSFKKVAQLIHEVGGLVYMDGANMNAIASWVNLQELGVDAVHNNLHKTWSISHGGGGPGDAIVAVSEKLAPYLPGYQVKKGPQGDFFIEKPEKSIGSVHRHWGNFAHKVRTYTYLKALGTEGVRKMSAVAVLSSRYLYEKLKGLYPTLPKEALEVPRMHEFILTLSQDFFEKAQREGVPKAQVMARVGKLFLDFGLHAPTVSFPEPFGLMIEPTESFSKEELDKFHTILTSIFDLLQKNPEVLTTAPHFSPVRKIDEVGAHKNLELLEKGGLQKLPQLPQNLWDPLQLQSLGAKKVKEKIIQAHHEHF